MKKTLSTLLLLCSFGYSFGQNTTIDKPKSNIQTYTPSALLAKGQWDIKWFNSLYTQTKSTFSDTKTPRESYFTSSLAVFTGTSTNKRINVGLLLEYKSNVLAKDNMLAVFDFKDTKGVARHGLSSFAPAIKFAPFKTFSRFSVQTAFHIPLVSKEKEYHVFLDQNGYILQNSFFYDYSFAAEKFQLFTELNTEYNFGDKAQNNAQGTTIKGSFANNSLVLAPAAFLSYFPSQNTTVLVFAQQYNRLDLGNDFSQDYTALGFGAKYQLTKIINLEALYSNFVRGTNTGLGQTFNLGLRAVL